MTTKTSRISQIVLHMVHLGLALWAGLVVTITAANADRIFENLWLTPALEYVANPPVMSGEFLYVVSLALVVSLPIVIVNTLFVFYSLRNYRSIPMMVHAGFTLNYIFSILILNATSSFLTGMAVDVVK